MMLRKRRGNSDTEQPKEVEEIDDEIDEELLNDFSKFSGFF